MSRRPSRWTRQISALSGLLIKLKVHLTHAMLDHLRPEEKPPSPGGLPTFATVESCRDCVGAASGCSVVPAWRACQALITVDR